MSVSGHSIVLWRPLLVRSQTRPSESVFDRIGIATVGMWDTIAQNEGTLMARAPSPPISQAAAVPFSPDLTGPSEFRTVVSQTEMATEYKLDDGTILRIRPVLVDVRRLIGQWAPDGDPVYVTKIGFAISTQAPAHLRRSLTEGQKHKKSSQSKKAKRRKK